MRQGGGGRLLAGRMVRWACGVLAGALVLAACGGGPARVAGAPAGRPVLYVAIGASETVGYGAQDPLTQAWPQVLFRRYLPESTTLINLGIPGATVATALSQELPEALTLHAQLATVWLNVNDALHFVPVRVYQQQLTSLLTRLRDGGRTAVFVANTPPLQDLPAYLACRPHPPASAGPCRLGSLESALLPGPAGVEAYVQAFNRAIAAAAGTSGATVVNLYAAGLAAERNGTYASLIGPDGFHPSTKGHAEVAALFAVAISRSGLLARLAAAS